MTHSITPAAPADIPTLIDLMAEFYAESGFPLPVANAQRAFGALLADPRLGAAWIGRTEEGEPTGHVVLTVCYSMEYGGLRGFIDDLFVRPAARGQGVAAALLDAVAADCGVRGVRALHVEVGPENAVAQRVYARSGFVESGHTFLTRPLAAPLHLA
jgi:GNAT superfamily N-acetyltransferase